VSGMERVSDASMSALLAATVRASEAAKLHKQPFASATHGTRFGQFRNLYPELADLFRQCDPQTIASLVRELQSLRHKGDAR
jgi:hypothetical protein